MAVKSSSERFLFVSNLDQEVSDEMLYELFVQAGPIEDCSIINKSKSSLIGMIVYKHYVSVNYAKDIFEGTTLYNKQLIISLINPMSETDMYGKATLRGERPFRDGPYGSRHQRSDRGQHDRRSRHEPYDAMEYRWRGHRRHHNEGLHRPKHWEHR